MQKYFNQIKFTAIVALATIVVGCGIFDTERDPAVYDGEPLVKFTNSSRTFIVQEESTIFTFNAHLIKPAVGELTYSFEVVTDETTAQEGSQYELESTSVTFADGELTSAINITLFSAGFGVSAETLTLRLNSPGMAEFDRTITLTLQRFFPYIQSEFVGTYRVTYPFWQSDPYEIDVIAGPTENELIAIDMFPGELGRDVTIIMDDSDSDNFTASFAGIDIWRYQGTSPTNINGSGTFSAANKSFNFTAQNVVPGVGAFDPSPLQMVRIGD
ncbi:MAG: hypothetical protein LAT57_06600 [Balneolales bacterium]|nr:hypothetical protein [Balneolales bacterium]